MLSQEPQLGLVKFLLEDGKDAEFYGVVKLSGEQVVGLGRKGSKVWEVCHVAQVVSFDSEFKKHR